MSYYMQSSSASTWHRAAAPRMFIMIIQPKQVGAGIPGAWVRGSKAPILQENGLAGLYGAQVSAVLWPLWPLPSSPPLLTASRVRQTDLNAGSATYRLCDLRQVTGPLQASDPTFIPPGIGIRVA